MGYGGTAVVTAFEREQALEGGFRRDRNHVHSRHLRRLTGTQTIYCLILGFLINQFETKLFDAVYMAYDFCLYNNEDIMNIEL